MQEDQDGRGEGYGKYAGLSVSETQKIFERCVTDPSMRSVSAILRITREQLEARGNLGVYPRLAWIAGVAAAIGGATWLLAPSGFKDIATKFVLGAGCVFGMVLMTVVSTMRARKRNVAQEEAIKSAAVAAIAEILKSNPVLKPLTIEQDFTVKLMLRKNPDSEPLRRLLAGAENPGSFT